MLRGFGPRSSQRVFPVVVFNVTKSKFAGSSQKIHFRPSWKARPTVRRAAVGKSADCTFILTCIPSSRAMYRSILIERDYDINIFGILVHVMENCNGDATMNSVFIHSAWLGTLVLFNISNLNLKIMYWFSGFGIIAIFDLSICDECEIWHICDGRQIDLRWLWYSTWRFTTVAIFDLSISDGSNQRSRT